jgi:hypothetical protein
MKTSLILLSCTFLFACESSVSPTKEIAELNEIVVVEDDVKEYYGTWSKCEEREGFDESGTEFHDSSLNSYYFDKVSFHSISDIYDQAGCTGTKQEKRVLETDFIIEKSDSFWTIDATINKALRIPYTAEMEEELEKQYGENFEIGTPVDVTSYMHADMLNTGYGAFEISGDSLYLSEFTSNVKSERPTTIDYTAAYIKQ